MTRENSTQNTHTRTHMDRVFPDPARAYLRPVTSDEPGDIRHVLQRRSTPAPLVAEEDPRHTGVGDPRLEEREGGSPHVIDVLPDCHTLRGVAEARDGARAVAAGKRRIQPRGGPVQWVETLDAAAGGLVSGVDLRQRHPEQHVGQAREVGRVRLDSPCRGGVPARGRDQQ